MAWNQPGGGQNNPWGRRPGGGPDLEARVKDWQRKLESLFRGAGGDGDESPGGGSLVGTIVLLLALVWLLSGFFTVEAAERGVIQRFGKLVSVKPEGWGWHWPWPIESVTKVNVQNINSSDYKSRVLTADVNLVDLRFAVQYRFSDPIKVLFKVRDPRATLNEVSEAAIREIVGQSDLEDVLVGKTRPEVTRRSKELIQRTLDFYNAGITVTSVNLTNVQVPEAVIPSQADANKALADQERLVKEAQAYANGIIPVAQGAAARKQQDAEAYRAQVVQQAEAYSAAPDVTRKRLYLDTMENVMSRSRKVIIDKQGAGAGGNILYLPLDKLMDRSMQSSEHAPEPSIRVTPADSDSDGADGRVRAER
jgi:membrane protease subunit HflK